MCSSSGDAPCFAQLSLVYSQDELGNSLTVGGMRRMWHLWPGQLWPFTLEQEVAFATDLRNAATRTSRSDRDDLTALLGILRCGCGLDGALRLAPGLRINRLASAYNTLSENLEAARASWTALTECAPSETSQYAERAALLVPGLVGRITAAAHGAAAEPLTIAVRSVVHQVDVTRFRTRQIEERCASLPPGSPMVVDLGSELFHPYRPGAYASPTYIPDRVSALSPVRVSDLLGLARL